MNVKNSLENEILIRMSKGTYAVSPMERWWGAAVGVTLEMRWGHLD